MGEAMDEQRRKELVDLLDGADREIHGALARYSATTRCGVTETAREAEVAALGGAEVGGAEVAAAAEAIEIASGEVVRLDTRSRTVRLLTEANLPVTIGNVDVVALGSLLGRWVDVLVLPVALDAKVQPEPDTTGAGPARVVASGYLVQVDTRARTATLVAESSGLVDIDTVDVVALGPAIGRWVDVLILPVEGEVG